MASAGRGSTATILIGRQAHLQTIEAAYDVARRGRLRIVLCTGDPGIGKTHLLSAAADRLTAIGARVLCGGASEAEAMPPYLPFFEALAPWIRQAPQPNRSFGPFYWATGGRATLNTRLPVDVAEPQGLPGIGLPKPTAMPTHVGDDPPVASPTPPDRAAPVGTPLPAIPLTVESDAGTSSGAARCAILPTLVLGTGTVAGAARKRRHD